MTNSRSITVERARLLLERDAADASEIRRALDFLGDLRADLHLELSPVSTRHAVDIYRLRLRRDLPDVFGMSPLFARLAAEGGAEGGAEVLMSTVTRDREILSLWFDETGERSLGFILGPNRRPID